MGTSITHQSFEMFHEHLQADIIGENGGTSPSTAGRTVHALGHVCRGRIKFRQQEASLGASLIAYNVTRNREAVNKKVLNRG